ncbi:MAG: phage head morphogenesis protein [Mediterranea sp.]|jgi:SPP1 gp7 family putative phage head morphogenesis protein|nr:phage head morphogenesis protein [Mediterranea sp.]
MKLARDEETEKEKPDTSQVEAAFTLLMAWLHRQRDFTPEMLRDEEAQKFIRTHASLLDKAVDYSIREVPMDEVSVARLKESNYVFSGYKTFHELNEAFPSLVADDGTKKPFETFLNDVQTINENYNRHYLRSEYNFAMASSRMAARWKDFERDDDRYDLQYRTVADERVRRSHRLLHNITLPITSKFWDWYFPPNGWGCRCTVVQVRKGKYPLSDEREAMNLGSQATAGKHQEMFRFNPGKRMACFPYYNPYTIKRCQNCEFQPLKLAKRPDNPLCGACKILGEITKRKEILKARRKEIMAEAKKMREEIFRNPDFDRDIHLTGKGIDEWLNQPHKFIVEKNEMLLNIKDVLEKARYLGGGQDKNDLKATAHLFETLVGGEKSWIIVKEYRQGEVNLYSISDSKDILNILK